MNRIEFIRSLFAGAVIAPTILSAQVSDGLTVAEVVSKVPDGYQLTAQTLEILNEWDPFSKEPILTGREIHITIEGVDRFEEILSKMEQQRSACNFCINHLSECLIFTGVMTSLTKAYGYINLSITCTSADLEVQLV